MVLTLYTFPQLAVSAKLLCLLMVMICGAVPSMVRSVKLYNECSHGHLSINQTGHVRAEDNPALEKYQNLTIRSQDFTLKLTIYAEDSKRFLCFNRRWKLVGKTKPKGPMCQFYENMFYGQYNQYSSVANTSHMVGFTIRGLPLASRMPIPQKLNRCFNFLKFDDAFSINSHNNQVALYGSAEPPPSPRRRATSPPSTTTTTSTTQTTTVSTSTTTTTRTTSNRRLAHLRHNRHKGHRGHLHQPKRLHAIKSSPEKENENKKIKHHRGGNNNNNNNNNSGIHYRRRHNPNLYRKAIFKDPPPLIS